MKAPEELLHGSNKRRLLLPSSLQSYIFCTKISNKSPKIWSIFLIIFIKPSVEDTVYGVPKVLFRRCERGHTRQEKHCHLFLFDDDNHDNYDDNHDDNDDNNDDDNDDNDDDDASVALMN